MRIKLIDQLASKGSIFSFKEAKEILEFDYLTTKVVLSRLEKKGWIERIEKGKYMIMIRKSTIVPIIHKNKKELFEDKMETRLLQR